MLVPTVTVAEAVANLLDPLYAVAVKVVLAVMFEAAIDPESAVDFWGNGFSDGDAVITTESAFVAVQDNVDDPPDKTVVGFAEKVIVGFTTVVVSTWK